jgi:hypothetical protein
LKHRFLALVTALASAALLSAGPALATSNVVDQQQTGVTAVNVQIDLEATRGVQTFTAGFNGDLVEADAHLQQVQTVAGIVPNATDTVTMHVAAVVAGVPSGPWLASASVVASEGWVDFHFASPPAIVAGSKYALVLVPDAGVRFRWDGTCEASAYGAGQALIFYDSAFISPADYGTSYLDTGSVCLVDFGFRTVMANTSTANPSITPPPTSAVETGTTSNGSALPLLLATGVFAALAYVTIRRAGIARR